VEMCTLCVAEYQVSDTCINRINVAKLQLRLHCNDLSLNHVKQRESKGFVQIKRGSVHFLSSCFTMIFLELNAIRVNLCSNLTLRENLND
jgi:hypothetical protein